MRILVVSQYYYPENFRINDICAELVQRGHDVHVLTGLPNYPGGDFFDGYSRSGPFEQEHEGVKIHRVKILPRKQNKIMLALNYASFVVTGRRAARRLAMRGFDAIFVYEVSPITMVIPAIRVKQIAGAPLVTYITDLWPENVQAAGGVNSGLMLRLVGRMVDWIYRKCDAVLTSSESFVDAIEARGHPRSKLAFWPQYAEDFYRPVEPDPQLREQIPEGFCLMFTGNLGFAQGLDTLVSAAAELSDMPDLRVVFVGGGRAEQALREQTKRLGVEDKVVFLPARPATEIPGLLAYADAAVLMLNDDPVFRMTLPAKLQSYFACGVPVLGSISGEGTRVIRDSQAGLECPPSDPKAFADIVRQFRALPETERLEMGRRARAYCETHYSRSDLIDGLEQTLAAQAGLSLEDGK